MAVTSDKMYRCGKIFNVKPTTVSREIKKTRIPLWKVVYCTGVYSFCFKARTVMAKQSHSHETGSSVGGYGWQSEISLYGGLGWVGFP